MAKKPKPQKQPFLPLFVGDFLAATDEWEGEEEGLYFACLARQWTIGSLPADPVKLARLLKWNQVNFDRYWPVVRRKFIEHEDPILGARLSNHRLELHREKTIEISKKNSEAGKRGAAKTWRKDGERHPESMANATNSDGARQKSAMQKGMACGHGNPSHPIPSHPDPSSVLPPSSQVPGVGTPSTGAESTHPFGQGSESRTEGNGERQPPDTFALTDRVKAAYPAGTYGQQNWVLAERALGARLDEGVTAEQLLDAAAKYCEQQTAIRNVGTEFIRSPEKFYGLGFWRGPFPLPKTASASSLSIDELKAKYPEAASG